MPTTYTTKKRAKQWRKNGNEAIEYWLQNEAGYVKNVSPMQFHKSHLPDLTAPETLDCAAAFAIGRLQFNKQVDFNTFRRKTAGKSLAESAKEFGLVF